MAFIHEIRRTPVPDYDSSLASPGIIGQPVGNSIPFGFTLGGIDVGKLAEGITHLPRDSFAVWKPAVQPDSDERNLSTSDEGDARRIDFHVPELTSILPHFPFGVPNGLPDRVAGQPIAYQFCRKCGHDPGRFTGETRVNKRVRN